MLRVDFILVIFDDSSLLICVQVWSPIFIMWLSLSLISTDAMDLHKPPVEQRQVEIPHLRWDFRVNFRPSNSSPFRPLIVVVVLATPNDFSVVWGLCSVLVECRSISCSWNTDDSSFK